MNPFYENKERAIQISEVANLEFPEHLHSHVEILFVREGCIDVQVMHQQERLSCGDCAVIFPQQIHSYRSPVCNRSRLLIFHGSLAGSHLQTIQKYSPSVSFLPRHAIPPDAVLAMERLYAILCPADAPNLPPPFADTDLSLCAAWVQLLLVLLLPHLALERNNRQTQGTDLTMRLVRYIMEHFQEPLTLDLLARELHVNKYYLSHTFSSRLQMPFRQYINRIRLEHALQLIRETDMPLTAIWAAAGFNSQRSFNRSFLDIMGMTPVTYRKAQK